MRAQKSIKWQVFIRFFEAFAFLRSLSIKFHVESLLKKAKASKNEASETSEIATEDSAEDATKEQTLMMKVPYTGKKGEGLVRGLKTCLQYNLPDNIKCRIVQTGTKISRNFNMKDKVDKNHLSNFLYR